MSISRSQSGWTFSFLATRSDSPCPDFRYGSAAASHPNQISYIRRTAICTLTQLRDPACQALRLFVEVGERIQLPAEEPRPIAFHRVSLSAYIPVADTPKTRPTLKLAWYG